MTGNLLVVIDDIAFDLTIKSHFQIFCKWNKLFLLENKHRHAFLHDIEIVVLLDRHTKVMREIQF